MIMNFHALMKQKEGNKGRALCYISDLRCKLFGKMKGRDLVPGVDPVTCKWVDKLIGQADGSIERTL
jgi:hypothetical protein